jgi:hypothetical protein
LTDLNDDEVAWIATPHRAPVLDASGDKFGTAESLLGDEEADIFHGIVVKLDANGEYRELLANSITRITRSDVETSIPPGGADQLGPYQEQRWFHLGWGGLFRKRPEWKEGE